MYWKTTFTRTASGLCLQWRSVSCWGLFSDHWSSLPAVWSSLCHLDKQEWIAASVKEHETCNLILRCKLNKEIKWRWKCYIMQQKPVSDSGSVHEHWSLRSQEQCWEFPLKCRIAVFVFLFRLEKGPKCGGAQLENMMSCISKCQSGLGVWGQFGG